MLRQAVKYTDDAKHSLAGRCSCGDVPLQHASAVPSHHQGDLSMSPILIRNLVGRSKILAFRILAQAQPRQ